MDYYQSLIMKYLCSTLLVMVLLQVLSGAPLTCASPPAPGPGSRHHPWPGAADGAYTGEPAASRQLHAAPRPLHLTVWCQHDPGNDPCQVHASITVYGELAFYPLPIMSSVESCQATCSMATVYLGLCCRIWSPILWPKFCGLRINQISCMLIFLLFYKDMVPLLMLTIVCKCPHFWRYTHLLRGHLPLWRCSPQVGSLRTSHLPTCHYYWRRIQAWQVGDRLEELLYHGNIHCHRDGSGFIGDGKVHCDGGAVTVKIVCKLLTLDIDEVTMEICV